LKKYFAKNKTSKSFCERNTESRGLKLMVEIPYGLIYQKKKKNFELAFIQEFLTNVFFTMGNPELGNCNYPKYKYLLKDSFKYILVLAITLKKFGHTCICTCTCGRNFLPFCKYFSRSFQLLFKYFSGLKKII
jgi:hypothetical protein